MKKVKDILKANGLRLTDNRKLILEYLLDKQYAIPHSEMEKHFEDMDRVTIYRTLNSFIEKGIVHEVSDGSGASKFALCSSDCSIHEHHDEHIHFRCTECEQTTCIDTVLIPPIELPNGYQFLSSSYIINGVCESCG